MIISLFVRNVRDARQKRKGEIERRRESEREMRFEKKDTGFDISSIKLHLFILINAFIYALFYTQP